jgi:hypothetical protein
MAQIQLPNRYGLVLISATLARSDGGERLHQPGAAALAHQCGGYHRCAAWLVGAPL